MVFAVLEIGQTDENVLYYLPFDNNIIHLILEL